MAEIKEKGFSPLSLRYFFLQAHYRSKQNFTWQALEAAEEGLKHLYNQTKKLGTESGKINKEYKEKFIKALSDDFNTPQALAIVQELLKSNLSDTSRLATLLDFDKVLGLKIESASWRKEKIPEEVIELAKKRLELRKSGKWQEADELRQKIENFGYEVEDTDEGYILNAIGRE